MIVHAVYLFVPEGADQAELSHIMVSLSELVGQIEGFTGFHHGPNIDVECKSPEAQYGFTGYYDDGQALERYAADPRHQSLGARLVALCGGADGIKVYDIDTGEV